MRHLTPDPFRFMILRAPADEAAGGGGDAAAAETPAATETPAETPSAEPGDTDGGEAEVKLEDRPLGAGPKGDDTAAGGEGEDTQEGDGEKPAPKAPEAYELAPPEGYDALDTDMLAAAEPLLRELDLDNAQAQALVNRYAADVLPGLVSKVEATVQERTLEQVVDTARAWRKAAMTDAEIGAPDAMAWQEKTGQFVDAFKRQFGTPELDALLEGPMGEHPEILRAFARAGKAISEQGFVPNNAGGGGDKTVGEAFWPGWKPQTA